MLVIQVCVSIFIQGSLYYINLLYQRIVLHSLKKRLVMVSLYKSCFLEDPWSTAPIRVKKINDIGMKKNKVEFGRKA